MEGEQGLVSVRATTESEAKNIHGYIQMMAFQDELMKERLRQQKTEGGKKEEVKSSWPELEFSAGVHFQPRSFMPQTGVSCFPHTNCAIFISLLVFPKKKKQPTEEEEEWRNEFPWRRNLNQ